MTTYTSLFAALDSMPDDYLREAHPLRELMTFASDVRDAEREAARTGDSDALTACKRLKPRLLAAIEYRMEGPGFNPWNEE